jgi:hypothetical protein
MFQVYSIWGKNEDYPVDFIVKAFEDNHIYIAEFAINNMANVCLRK